MSRRESPIPESAGTETRATVSADAMFTVSAVAVRRPAAVVSAAGKLAGAAAAARLAAVLEHQRATGCHFVHLDLSELSLLDRAGFDVLVEAHHHFLAAGGALVMTGVGPRIARLLQLTGVHRTLFTIPRASELPIVGADRAAVAGAVSIVLGHAHCDVTEAIEQLARLARGTNRTLGQVAQSILDEDAKPDRTRVGYARPASRSDWSYAGPEAAGRKTLAAT
jgi:anti-sigma B factor antagonist